MGQVAACQPHKQQDAYQPECLFAKGTCLLMDDPWLTGEDEDSRCTHKCRDQHEIKHTSNLLLLR